MGESTRRSALAERTLAAKPRLVLVAAGAGWGKSHFARELCEAAASPLLVDGGDPIVQKPWSLAEHDVVVIDDADRLVEAGGAQVLAELIRALPARSTLVLTSQLPLEGVDLTRFAPHEVVTVRRDALALEDDVVRELVGAAFMPTALLETAVERAQGWPILVFLFVRFAQEGNLEEALRDSTSWVLEPFHQYMKTRALARLPEDEKSFAIAVAALGESTEEEISAATGYDLRQFIADLPRRRYRAYDVVDGRYSMLEVLRGAVLAAFPETVREMRLRAARSLNDSGRHVRAAGLAADAGDFAFATACLDAAGRRGAGEIPSLEYETVALRLPVEHVFRSENVYLELFGSRRVRATPRDLYLRVRAFCDEMSPDVDPFVRYSARVALVACLRMTFHSREAEVHARDCEVLAASFPHARDRRALLRAERAVIASVNGMIDDADWLWQKFDDEELPGSAWFEHHRHVTEFGTALYSGNADALVRVAELNAEYARLWNDEATTRQGLQLLFLAYAAAGLRDKARATVTMIDGDDPEIATPTTRLLGIIAAIGQSDAGLGGRLIAQSLEGDRYGYPYWQIVIRLAAAHFPQFDRATLLRESLEVAARTQAPKLQVHIRVLQSDPSGEGIFTPFLHAVAASPLVRDALFRVRLLDRKVTRNGADVKVRQREFELLAHLALAGGAASNEALCEAMYPDSDEQSAIASLRMSVHRLRKQLDDSSAVASVAIGYQLDPRVAVDILEAEDAFVALRRLPEPNEEDRTSLHALFQYLCSANGAVSERESWFDKVARRIEELRHGAGVLLAKEYLRSGEPLKALEAAEVLMRFDELDEESVSLCVKALAAANDKSAAMRLWRQYVKRLSADYGAQPAVSVDDLVGV